MDVDPEDPAQQLDETGDFHVEPLAVEAQPAAERQDELDEAIAETAAEPEGEAPPDLRDTGDLYGVHLPPAVDRDLTAPEDEDAFHDSALGETWLEALEETAAEGGVEPGHELDVLDDSDPHRTHHSTDTRDRPVADKGSGGRGGL